MVTKVSILVPAKLGSVNTAFLACENYESCQVKICLALSFSRLLNDFKWYAAISLVISQLFLDAECVEGSEGTVG